VLGSGIAVVLLEAELELGRSDSSGIDAGSFYHKLWGACGDSNGIGMAGRNFDKISRLWGFIAF